ncbi:hypothetical protein [uncultured Microbacterium sp.]|uniref:hypothetical protein n=1 Tax=Microbacterium algeriense TaxID=2615184 RepID=UPI002594ED53|nr:hypothetical protein [uncultured Microbacterium sp.]
MNYPAWSYFPRNARPPAWAVALIEVVSSARTVIDTEPSRPTDDDRLTSDYVLSVLRPGMEHLGYVVESGKLATQRIRRPVLFGDNGRAEVSYEIDAFHDELGIAVEVEAGRGAMGNADYRDIIRMSLLLDAEYMVLMTPSTYRYGSTSTSAFARTRDQLSAIYASDRLRLPFSGVLLVGY